MVVFVVILFAFGSGIDAYGTYLIKPFVDLSHARTHDDHYQNLAYYLFAIIIIRSLVEVVSNYSCAYIYNHIIHEL